MATIFPSLIAVNEQTLDPVLKLLDPHVYGYHLDVMDGKFVPNTVWSPAVVNTVDQKTNRILWVHLMVANPQEWIDKLDLPANTILTFHIEAVGQNIKLVEQIKAKSWVPSVAVNPKTEIETIFPLLDTVPHVLVMSVQPGFAGQDFIPGVLEKVEKLVGYRQTSGLDITIGIDGGINKGNIQLAVERGVDHIAVASAVFGGNDPVGALEELNQLIG